MKDRRCKDSKVKWLLGLALVVYLLFIPYDTEARGLAEEKVRAAVQTWVRQVTAEARPDALIERMEPYEVDGKTTAYIAHLLDGGYCLCGADDLVAPVYFYSSRGSYSKDNPACQSILGEIAQRTKALAEGTRERTLELLEYEEALAGRALFWQDLIAGRAPPQAEEIRGVLAAPDRMELPLNTIWGQGSPYNDQCPNLTSGVDERTLVGCTATAASQIMYYWQWPNTGVGSRSINYDFRWRTTWDEEPLINNPNIPADWGGGGRLEWTAANGGRLRMNGYWDGSVYGTAIEISTDSAYRSALPNLWNRLTSGTTANYANFGSTTYNWSLMQNRHTDPVDTGDMEVAKLCYHVAIAVDTGFGIWWSGSDNWRVPGPLRDYFRYDPDVTYGPPDIDDMTEEIEWLRPIGFSGGPPGHAWVIYGYNKGTDPNRQFKMNMGWDGSSDGWYTLDSIPRGIKQNHNQLIRMAPLDVVKFVADLPPGPYPDPGRGSPGLPYNHIEEALSRVGDGTSLIFRAGSTNTFAASSLLINRPLTLKGMNVIIQKQ
jgi:hypothetical protein